MGQFPMLPNPTYRLLQRIPRLRSALRLPKFQNDQLGFDLPNMPDFSGGGSYSPIINNSPSKFETIFNGALSIGSQIVGAFGKNKTTQIASNGGKISALPTPYGSAGQVSANQQAQTQALQTGGLGQQAGQTVVSGFDSLAASFGVSSTTMFVIGGIGLYLLFRPSPGSRR